jgi:hypothetical protein
MEKFLKKISLFVLSFPFMIFIVAFSTSLWVERNHFNNDETESNTLVIENNQNYDLAFLGISHARNFSRYQNHQMIENKINKTILNLGQGASSCGPNEQLFYLSYTYSKNITIDTIIYVLSPPLLYSNELNIASSTFDLESFKISFLYQYLQHPSENKAERLFHYIKSKLNPEWFFHTPLNRGPNTRALKGLDSLKVQEGFKLAYPYGLQNDTYIKSCKVIETTIQLAKKNNSTVIFIIPPALFGKWPGHAETYNLCEKMKQIYGCGCYDFSESMLDANNYYDHHHLNSSGVEYFVKNYLSVVLNK